MQLLCIPDFEKAAKARLDKIFFEFYRTGAGEELTLRMNMEGFRRLRIRPRCLRDVSTRNTTFKIFDLNVKTPIGISPTAIQKVAHPEGEVASAKAAGKLGSVFILSCMASSSIEELADNAPNTQKWMQIFIYKERSLTESLVRRAEKAGFKALVLTIDYPRLGICRNTVRDNFTVPIPLANFTEILSARKINAKELLILDSSLTWKDVDWLVEFTTLPVIVKGVLTKEDALLAVDHGCSGIIVSNHGARQLDGVPATIEALSDISKAVADKIPVMLDGGISQGTDVFKALALGAKMVFIGRPVIWGLAVNGEKGVDDVLNILCKEFEATMELSGCSTLSDINRNMIAHELSFAKL